eukprot:COSAG05_NODE_1649_length_4339_cov_2.053066_1_plen_234_part_00
MPACALCALELISGFCLRPAQVRQHHLAAGKLLLSRGCHRSAVRLDVGEATTSSFAVRLHTRCTVKATSSRGCCQRPLTPRQWQRRWRRCSHSTGGGELRDTASVLAEVLGHFIGAACLFQSVGIFAAAHGAFHRRLSAVGLAECQHLEFTLSGGAATRLAEAILHLWFRAAVFQFARAGRAGAATAEMPGALVDKLRSARLVVAEVRDGHRTIAAGLVQLFLVLARAHGTRH